MNGQKGIPRIARDAIGIAGAGVTIQRHGVAFFRGITARKGWHGRRPMSLRADLAAGRVDAARAA